MRIASKNIDRFYRSKYWSGSIHPDSSVGVATYPRISISDHRWIARCRCLRSPSVSWLKPLPRIPICSPDWIIAWMGVLMLSNFRWPYMSVTVCFFSWHCCTATPPYPVPHFFSMSGPVHMDRITISSFCSEGKVSKSTPVWYPVNRSGKMGEWPGETWSQNVFFVTRLSAWSMGKVISQEEEVAGLSEIKPVLSLGTGTDTGGWLSRAGGLDVQLASNKEKLNRMRSMKNQYFWYSFIYKWYIRIYKIPSIIHVLSWK